MDDAVTTAPSPYDIARQQRPTTCIFSPLRFGARALSRSPAVRLATMPQMRPGGLWTNISALLSGWASAPRQP